MNRLVRVFSLLVAFTTAPYSSAQPLTLPLRTQWIVHFNGERVGTAVDPVIADDRLFITTHAGSVWCLDAATARPLWHFIAAGPILHSPAYDRDTHLLFTADADRTVYALHAADGSLAWSFSADRGGFAASPCLLADRLFIGSRAGTFYALDARTGHLAWEHPLSAPIRQPAAADHDRVFVTTEDLRTHCLDVRTGNILWTSTQLNGQSARDYLPVIAHRSDGRAIILIRTSPARPMPQRLQRDLTLLCRNAGLEPDWKKIDAWTKSDAALGSPDLWSAEQSAIRKHLAAEPDAQTCYLLDAATGKPTATAPILWLAGCQAVPAPPVPMPDGKLLTLYRSAYGNWTHGVAAFVALGLLSPDDGSITPLHHADGHGPPWNTFWGTADESLRLTPAGKLVLISHQSTLSAFDLTTHHLTPIAGARDSWGGLPNLPWARNEWNGPARSAAVVAANRVYWITGSRLFCLAPAADAKQNPTDTAVDAANIPTTRFPPPPITEAELRTELTRAVDELLSQPWAPLFVSPGIGGIEFHFTHSDQLFESLIAAHQAGLPPDLAARVEARLAAEWTNHPPFDISRNHDPVAEGLRREPFTIPADLLKEPAPNPTDEAAHALRGLYASYRYAEALNHRDLIKSNWPALRSAFSTSSPKPPFNPLHANTHLAACLAVARMADWTDDPATRAAATQLAEQLTAFIQSRSRSAADQFPTIALTPFPGVQQLDAFLSHGDPLFRPVHPHQAKLSLFHNLTPDAAAATNPDTAGGEPTWRTFTTLCPTWHLTTEERQLHYGENLFDPPDFSLDAFLTATHAHRLPPVDLPHRVDLPFCKADLDYIQKLAAALHP